MYNDQELGTNDSRWKIHATLNNTRHQGQRFHTLPWLSSLMWGHISIIPTLPSLWIRWNSCGLYIYNKKRCHRLS